MRTRSAKMYPAYFILPAAAIFSVFYVVPVLSSFVLSFTDWNIERLMSPSFNGLKNFAYLFKNEYFLLSVKNTFIFAITSVVLKLVFGLLLALGLTYGFKGQNVLRTIFVLPCALNMVVIGIICIAFFRLDGPINGLLRSIGLGSLATDWIGSRATALGISIVADVWRWMGFSMAIFVAGLQGIPHDFYEAAQIDGASGAQAFLRITLPLLIPSFNVAIIFGMVGGMKVFEQVFVITGGGPGYASQVLSTYLFEMFSSGLLGRSTSMALFLFVLIVVIYTGLRYLLRKAEVEY